MDCRVYSLTYINLCLWAIKWTGFGFGASNGCVAHFPTLGLSFGWLERFSSHPPNEPKVGLFSKLLFLEIVVYLENVFDVGFVPCL